MREDCIYILSRMESTISTFPLVPELRFVGGLLES